MKYAAAFVAVIVAANLATAQWGVVSFLGVTATAGTALAGFGFVARDALQDAKGSRWVMAAIAAGAALTAAFSPALAVASAAAFIVSEAADWGVYTPLRKRHRLGAALASNSVGALLDSVVFLAVAGFPIAGAPAQTVVKIATTSAFVLGVRFALPRQPLHAASGRRHDCRPARLH